MNSFMEQNIEEIIIGSIDGGIYNIECVAEETNNTCDNLLSMMRNKAGNDDIPTILWNLMFDGYEIYHSELMDGCGTDILFDCYGEVDLWGEEPDCYYNFISVYSNLSNNNLIYDKMCEYIDEFGDPDDLDDFAENYAKMNGNNNFKAWPDIQSVFLDAIEVYLKDNYNEIINKSRDKVKDFISDITGKREFYNTYKDAFEAEDWGF